MASEAAPILYGEPVRVGDFPAVGHITAYVSERSVGVLCTGALIAPDTVLTAAHCLEPVPAGGEVYFARELTAFATLSARTERWSRAAGWVMHPDYVSADDGHLAHDLGLIFLAEPVAGVAAPALGDGPAAPYLQVGAEVTLVGFGRDETGLSGPLRKARSHLSFVGDAVVRTGGRAPAPSRCSGDSGGPTFMEVPDGRAPSTRLISVNSYGLQSCDSASTEGRVDVYLGWISATMAEACAAGTRPAGCAGVGPRRAEASAEVDAGTEGPALPAPPDAGFAEVVARAPEGCRCARPGAAGAEWGLLALGWALRRRRRRVG